MPISKSDEILIRQIRAGHADAWSQIVRKYEGRLMAFVAARIRDRATCEDLVQETFVGFMLSLPNFQDDQDLEAYLFTIASHKLIDQYRRMGRDRSEQMTSSEAGDPWNELPDDLRQVSSLLHSQERREAEHEWLKRALGELIGDWLGKGEYDRVRCLELIFVKNWANKEIARYLGMTETAVAGLKFQALSRLKNKALGRMARQDT